MTIREVLLLGDPILRNICESVDDISTLNDLFDDLKDTLTRLQEDYGLGRGLAAPQIGYNKRIVYIQVPDRSFYLINPKITSRSKETFDVWDSCFSMKASFFVKIPRNRQIRVEYLDRHGKEHAEYFHDGLSELLQHEIDHLDGILCSDHLRSPKDIIMFEEWEKRHKEKGIGM
jgi:peptide deformylase